MTHLEWTEPAVVDLENIRDYVAKDSTEYAGALVERLILSAERLKSFPESGRLGPEAPTAKVREVLVSGYRSIIVCAKTGLRSWRSSIVHRILRACIPSPGMRHNN